MWKESEGNVAGTDTNPSLKNTAKLKLAHDHVKLELPFPQTGNLQILHLQLLIELNQHKKAHLSANNEDILWR